MANIELKWATLLAVLYLRCGNIDLVMPFQAAAQSCSTSTSSSTPPSSSTADEDCQGDTAPLPLVLPSSFLARPSLRPLIKEEDRRRRQQHFFPHCLDLFLPLPRL